MSRVTRRVAWGVGTAALLGVAGAARAVEPAPSVAQPPADLAASVPPLERPVRLQYVAHPECPDAAGFFAHVRARTQRVRLASPDEQAELAVIDIERTVSGSVGTLDLPPLDGHPFTRRVEAGTCQEVVLALSLVLALAYDPDAITTFPSTVTAAAAPIPIAPVPPYPLLSQPIAPPAVPAPEPAFGAATGISVIGTSGIAPSLHAIVGPFIEYGSTSKRPFHLRGMVSLYLGVPDATASVGTRQATLRFFGGQIAGCPLWVEILPEVTFAPCLAFDLGQVLGTAKPGGGIEFPLTDSLTFAAFELIARVRATIGGPLFAEVVGSGGLTLSYSEFTFVGVGNPVYKIPIGFGSFGLGLGVHFP